MKRLRGSGGRDDGAYAILYAVIVVVLIGIVSLVIDVGFVRSDRRANRAATDAGAIAGSQALGQGAPDAKTACKKAMRFAEASLAIGVGTDNCATKWPNATYDCTATPQTATEVVAGRRIEVTWPVIDSDPLMQQPDLERWTPTPIGQDIGTTDGPACRRVGVAIAQDRAFPFSSVWNNITHRRTSDSHSVGLTIYDFENGLEPAPLVVLDRTSCNALTVGGGGGVTVGNSGDGHSGLIAVDSDGSGLVSGINGADDCTGGKKVINAPSSGNHLWALDGTDPVTGATVPAQISLYALTGAWSANALNGNISASPPNGDMTNCTNQKTTAAWLALGSSGPHICPVPQPGAPVTSAPWAGRYNCGGQEPDLPAATTVPSPAPTRFGCYEPDPDNPLPQPGDYIDQWVRYAKGTAPLSFTNQLNSSTSTAWMNNCKITADHTFTGSTYSTCADLQTSNGVKVIFTDGPVVMTGSFSPSNSSCVLFNDTDLSHCTTKFVPVSPYGPDGGNIYIGGDVNFAGSSQLTFNQSFLYLGGKLTIKTSGIVNWIAPYGGGATPADPCVAATSTTTAPTAGCFDSLGLWSRYNAVQTGNNQDELTSSADIVVDGTLFMPRGYFKFGGGAINTQDRAQFVSLRLELRGQGELNMTPNTKRTTLIPLVVGSLIR